MSRHEPHSVFMTNPAMIANNALMVRMVHNNLYLDVVW